jgi:hypothetical protein
MPSWRGAQLKKKHRDNFTFTFTLMFYEWFHYNAMSPSPVPCNKGSNLLLMYVQETWYHPIAEDDMNVVMEYNCDYRRYTQATYAQHMSKRPIFYKSPERAEERYFHCNKALVVVKVISTSRSYATECSKDWDTEYYPEYIVVLHD